MTLYLTPPGCHSERRREAPETRNRNRPDQGAGPPAERQKQLVGGLTTKKIDQVDKLGWIHGCTG
jgi:hypothetical protein